MFLLGIDRVGLVVFNGNAAVTGVLAFNMVDIGINRFSVGRK